MYLIFLFLNFVVLTWQRAVDAFVVGSYRFFKRYLADSDKDDKDGEMCSAYGSGRISNGSPLL